MDFRNIGLIKKSIAKFKINKDGESYPVEISKERAWYIHKGENEFSHLASEYIEAANALINLNKTSKESFGVVPLYLALHGLELALKGALQAFNNSDYSIRKLKKFGHNITRLLSEYHKHFPELVVSFTQDKKTQITQIFNDYSQKGYEYLEPTHGSDQAKSIVTNYELIEEVLFVMYEKINEEITAYFDRK